MIIDASNIGYESDVNILAIVGTRQGFANPVDAAKRAGFAWEVEKDDMGNIRRVIRTIRPYDFAFFRNTGVIP